MILIYLGILIVVALMASTMRMRDSLCVFVKIRQYVKHHFT